MTMHRNWNRALNTFLLHNMMTAIYTRKPPTISFQLLDYLLTIHNKLIYLYCSIHNQYILYSSIRKLNIF